MMLVLFNVDVIGLNSDLGVRLLLVMFYFPRVITIKKKGLKCENLNSGGIRNGITFMEFVILCRYYFKGSKID